MQTTHVAAKTRGTYLGAQYRRIAARRGKKRALVALAHTILLIVYHILTRREPYRELGGMYFDQSPVGVAGPGAPDCYGPWCRPLPASLNHEEVISQRVINEIIRPRCYTGLDPRRAPCAHDRDH